MSWKALRHRRDRRLKRYPGRNYHHLVPRSRGGPDTSDNLALMRIERHAAWHAIFGNRLPEEALELLIRFCRIKGRPTPFHWLARLCPRCSAFMTYHWDTHQFSCRVCGYVTPYGEEEEKARMPVKSD